MSCDEVARLAALAVDVEPHGPLRRMADPARRDDRAAGRGRLEGLSHFPRAAELLRLALKIAAGHVEADRIAEDAVHGLFDRDVRAAGLQRDDELDLEMHVGACARVGELPVGAKRIGVLLEEERRLAVRVMSHLDRVLGVVAADAVEAPHRKKPVGADDRQGGDGCRREDVIDLGYRVHCLTPA